MTVKELIELIRRTTKETIEELLIEEFGEEESEQLEEDQEFYFKETERILFKYPAAKELLEQCDIEKPEDMSEKLYQAYMKKITEAKIIVKMVESALEYIKKYEYHEVIELYYFKGMTYIDIGERLHCSDKTAYRWKNRFINDVKIILFGIDALEIY